MKLLLVIFSMVMTSCCAYHILIINSVPSKSHFNLMNGFAEALVDGGHEVSLVTPNPGSKTKSKIKQIDVSALTKILESIDHDVTFNMFIKFNRDTGRTTITTPEVRKALVEEKFDAVVTDWMFSDPADAGYAAVLRVPWILLTGATSEPFLEAMVDRAPLVPTGPVIFHFTKEPMDFWARLMNTFWQIRVYFQMTHWEKVAEEDYNENFGPIAKARGVPLPPFSEAKYNFSMIFLNEYPPASQVKSLPPNMIQIGGYHIAKEIPPLPKDLEEIMNSSKNGVIYFSLGSWYNSTFLPKETRMEFVKLFGKLPYTVLWKHEEPIEGCSKNLHIRSWMPQSSILAHPNIKVFITHSGMLSTLESNYFGVPTVSMPTFGDQYNNAHRAEQVGTGIKLDLTENIVEDLEAALRKILADNSYHQRAKYYSSIFKNRPISPSKLILHHVEEAIRTKGSSHLRSKASLYQWYQLWMLDQLTFVTVILYIIYRLLKFLAGRITKQHSSTEIKLKKK